tara:strand:+ start:164 stop:427 length:264 start_codon:yes stop_codon:yes gene_type:complete
MNKKLYEYELTWTFPLEDDEEARNALDESPRKYYFKGGTAKEHNRQYTLSDVPRKLVKVKGGKVVEKPEWWSGTQEHLRELAENHKS